MPIEEFVTGVTIIWIRHGESCTNVDAGKTPDHAKNKNRKKGYENDTSVEQPTQIEIDDSNIESINKFKTRVLQVMDDLPNQEKIDLFKEINDQFQKHVNSPDCQDNKSSCDVSILRKLTAAIEYHPNLSFIGMQQASLLGAYFDRHGKLFDIIFVSPTVRAIMTALLAFRTRPFTGIYVVPFISENINLAGNFDKQNNPLKSDILKRQIAFVKDWFEKNWIDHYDDIRIMNSLKRIRDIVAESEIINSNELGLDVYKAYVRMSKNIQDVLTYRVITPISQRPEANYITDKIADIIEDLDKVKKIYDETNSNHSVFKANANHSAYHELDVIESFLKLTRSPVFLRGPPVHFSILEHFEGLQKTPNNHPYYLHQNLREPDMPRFYTEVLPLAYKKGILDDTNDLSVLNFVINRLKENGKIHDVKLKERLERAHANPNIIKGIFEERILPPDFKPFVSGTSRTVVVENDDLPPKSYKIACVSHGGTLFNSFSQRYSKSSVPKDLFNTQVIREVFTASSKGKQKLIGLKGEWSHDGAYYTPPLIRSIYQNFEDLNPNPCSANGLRGIINYPLMDESFISKLRPSFAPNDAPTESYVTEDVKFFFDSANNRKYRLPIEDDIVYG